MVFATAIGITTPHTGKIHFMFDYDSVFSLTNKTALLIGAGSGIGQACAEGLATFGAHVVCADLRIAEAEQVANGILSAGFSAEAREVDIRNSASIESLVQAIPQIDILLCTPSINVRKPMLQISDDEFDRVVALNLRGTFLTLRAVGKKMVDQGTGSMIVLSSIRSQVVEPGQSVYAATKAGVVQMVKALAAEVGTRGVRVNAIAPGVVETPLTAQIKNHPQWYQAYANKGILQRWAQPTEMVGAAIYLASEASSYVTGTVMFVDGGWTAVDGRFTPPL